MDTPLPNISAPKSIAEEIALGIQLLPLIQTGVAEFIAWLEELRASAQAKAEWTPEQDAAFSAALLARATDPAYLPEDPQEPLPPAA